MGILLREMKLKNKEAASLFLDINHEGRRSKEYLKLKVFTNPKDKIEKLHNKNMYDLANKLLVKREMDFLNARFEITESFEHLDFLAYFESFVTNYKKENKKVFEAVLKKFILFLQEKKIKAITGMRMSLVVCEDFATFLKYDKSLHFSTPSDYFKKFKQVLKRAKKERIVNIDLDEIQTNFKVDKNAIRKQILTFEEIELLYKTPSTQTTISNAFIFSLNTGIDFKTVSTITMNEIENGFLVFDRSKTGVQNRLKLNGNALKALPPIDFKNPHKFIFELPSWEMCVKSIRKWCKRAGINKKITWHSARHSLGAILVNDFDVNVYTLKEILGHSDIKTTMKYTRLSEQNKTEALDKMVNPKN